MNRDQKAAVIDEVAAEISGADAVFAVDYRGISVPQAAALRARLREADASFRIVKNTLTLRAADQAGAEGLKGLLEGPTAMTFVRGDAAMAAKALRDFRRANNLLELKGGWMNGSPLDADQIDAIAALPSREVLYGRLVNIVAYPLSGLAGALGNLVGGLARQLQQIVDQNPPTLVGGDAPAAETEPTPEPAPDPDAGPTASPEEPGPDPDPDPEPDTPTDQTQEEE